MSPSSSQHGSRLCALQHSSWRFSQHPFRQSSQHFLHPQLVPDRVSQHVQSLDWCNRVVARDDQLAAPRTLFRGLVPDHDAQARAGMQRRGERIVDQLPVLLLRLNATLVTCSVQSPTLQIEMVRSPRQQAFTPPNARRAGDGELAGRRIAGNGDALRGPVGSSLVTVIVPDFAPKLVGWKRIGTCREPPASMVSGYDKTLGTRNSAEEEVMPVIGKRALSAVAQGQHLVHERSDARVAEVAGVRDDHGQPWRPCASPDTITVLGPLGSLLITVIVADFDPKLAGWNRIGTSRKLPASMVSGYDNTLGTRNSRGR